MTEQGWPKERSFPERLKNGSRGEALTASYTREEYEHMSRLKAKVLAEEDGWREAMNELHTIHEMKAMFDAEPLTPEQAYALGLRDDEPVSDEARTEAMAAADRLEANGFKIPQAAKDAVRTGQTSMLANGSASAEKQEVASLSDPDAQQIGKFQAPDAGAATTQRRAAVLAYPRTGTQRRAVLDAIGAAGERGLTDEEAAQSAGILANTERPRRVELQEGGWIEDSGKRRKTSASGSDAVVWVLTAEGRTNWQPVGGAK